MLLLDVVGFLDCCSRQRRSLDATGNGTSAPARTDAEWERPLTARVGRALTVAVAAGTGNGQRGNSAKDSKFIVCRTFPRIILPSKADDTVRIFLPPPLFLVKRSNYSIWTALACVSTQGKNMDMHENIQKYNKLNGVNKTRFQWNKRPEINVCACIR
jgi:hypothetical protein